MQQTDIAMNQKAIKTKMSRKQFKKEFPFHVFIWVGMVFIFVFQYIPLFGILIAFKNYNITQGIIGIFTSEWAGLKYFYEFFNYYNIRVIITNTLAISLLKIVFAFPIPILFALMLNEVRNMLFKRVVQTATYLPHFVSWVVISGLLYSFFSGTSGVISNMLLDTGLISKPLDVLTNPNSFWALAVSSAIWKEFGWWAIIFLAAISGIDPSLYEAAEIDGASRLQRIWHITMPSIKGAAVVVLILSIGSMLGGGLVGSNFEQSYLLGNSINITKSEIIQTYALTAGLAQGRYAYATAIDLMQSVISVFLIFTSNYIAKRVAGSGLF